MAFAVSKRNSAFTLVEVILTIMVVAVGLVASLRTMPIIMKTSQATRDLLMAQQVATDLLCEIALLPYQDPGGTPVFGPEPGEGTTTRAAFDDVDDYNGWTASPPQKRDGTVFANSTGYTQAVAVESVNPADFTQVVTPGSSDAKRITVTIGRAGTPPAVFTTVRLRGVNRED